jgi:1,4-dihydroxy-2-naphthoate octaprenyltransferase
LQGAQLGTDLLLFSVPVSAWVAAILLINEVPDIDADAASGKRTLPVKLGLAGTSRLYLAIHVAAAAVFVAMAANGSMPLLAPLVPVGLLVLAAKAASAIRIGVHEREKMTQGIEATLAIHTVGSVWMIACMLFLMWWSPG